MKVEDRRMGEPQRASESNQDKKKQIKKKTTSLIIRQQKKKFNETTCGKCDDGNLEFSPLLFINSFVIALLL